MVTSAFAGDLCVLEPALALRGAFVAGLAEAYRTPDRARVFEALRTTDPGTGRHPWAHFFDGSFVWLGRGADGTAYTAFYSPYYDAAVRIDWDDARADARMRRAVAVDGAQFRGESAAVVGDLPA